MLGAITPLASFTDKNVGAGKTVSVNGISISGTDAGNTYYFRIDLNDGTFIYFNFGLK